MWLCFALRSHVKDQIFFTSSNDYKESMIQRVTYALQSAAILYIGKCGPPLLLHPQITFFFIKYAPPNPAILLSGKKRISQRISDKFWLTASDSFETNASNKQTDVEPSGLILIGCKTTMTPQKYILIVSRRHKTENMLDSVPQPILCCGRDATYAKKELLLYGYGGRLITSLIIARNAFIVQSSQEFCCKMYRSLKNYWNKGWPN